MSKMKTMLLTRSAPALITPAYANTLSAIIGDIYNAMDVVSRELVGFIPSAMRAPSVERAAVGQTVTYPIAPPQTASDIVPGAIAPTGADNTYDVGTMTISKARKVPFNFTGEEQRSLNAGSGVSYQSVQSMNIAQAIRTLTNEVERDLSVEAVNKASRAFGTAGTAPFGSDSIADLAQLKKILDDNGASPSMRSAVLNTTAGAALRSVRNLTRVNEAGSQMTLRQGELMDIFGMSLKETGQPESHTAGTAAASTTNATDFAVGARVITLASAGTGTFVAGDVVAFAGDTNRYVLTAGDTDVSNGGTITLAAPGLRRAIPASATAITRTASYDAAAVAFSMDALHVALRPPARPDEGDAAVDNFIVVDPRSGIPFEFSVYAQYRQMYAEVALAWGVHASKTEHIALLLG